MSGVIKSVVKVFKKVVKVVLKVLPYILAAAAIIYTGGAALGLVAGWGATAASITTGLGLSATSGIGAVLTGAVTSAGYGAAIGGIGSVVMGGDFGDGAKSGALVGAVTGGIGGAFSSAALPAAGKVSSVAKNGASLAGTTTAGVSVGAKNGLLQGAQSATNTAASSSGSVFSGATDVLGRVWDGVKDSPVAGQLISGLGKGLLASASSEDEAEALLARDRERADRIAENYGDPGTGLLASAGQLARLPADSFPTPQQRWDQPGEYVFNRQAGRIVFQPRQQVQAPPQIIPAAPVPA